MEQDLKHGGNNKETIMMTVNTFKKFCMKVSTKKSDQVCDYYIKMENIMHKYTHEKLLETNNKLIENERHKVLVKAHANKPIIYAIKLLCDCEISDGFYVKIGYSDKLQDRVNKLKDFFKCDIIVLDVFECKENRPFEQFIFNNKKFMDLKYEKVINNANSSREVIMVKSLEEYSTIKRFIEKNLYNFHSKTLEEKRLERDIKYVEMFKDDKEGLLKALELLSKIPIDVDITNKNKEEPETIMPKVIKLSTPSVNSYGPLVHLYDAENITKLVMVIESITEATRKIENSSFTHIKISARNKTPYLGYRWYLVNRNDTNPYQPKDIGETCLVKTHNTDYIAMVNSDKTQVLKVFRTQTDAAKYISQHASAICSALKYNNIISNHYWIFWEKLDDNLKSTYLDHLPEKINVRGTTIYKIDPENNAVLEKFQSISHATKKLHISPRKLKELCASQEDYYGYKLATKII